MTADLDPAATAAFFDALRAREFPMLDAQGLSYLDYTGAALPPLSLVRAHGALARESVFGNPHAEHEPSRASTAAIERARTEVLRFLDADPNEYTVCFTANATAAVKLVAESFPFRRGSRLVVSADNHNSINGVGAYALRAGAEVRTIPMTDALQLDDPLGRLARPSRRGVHLYAFPAQSNFSGAQHPLSLITEAQRAGYMVLLDAAAYLPSNTLSLRDVHPEFMALSFYKLFGCPTGVGALVARRDALAALQRPWFSGGTVDWVSVRHGRHRLRDGVESFEDGTPNYLGIAGLTAGFDFMRSIGVDRVHAHVQARTRDLLVALSSSTHANGEPMVNVYGPHAPNDRGGTVAFNLRGAEGRLIPCENVGALARDARIAVRCGCFCNPGAAEAAFHFPEAESLRCLQVAGTQGFTIQRFAECLGGDVAVGAVRASVGVATSASDVRRAVETMREIATSFPQ